MSITAVGICGELLLDNKSVGAEKAPAVQVKNVEAQSVKRSILPVAVSKDRFVCKVMCPPS